MARRVPLPQARAKKHAAGCGTRRPSRRSRWRALSLILVHVAAAVHIAQWMVTGTTLTPVEPSEAMQTLGQSALLNAGFVLFALLIISTFVFGRFFCGWGCHVVALQDLCTWGLRKAGIQPRPFRSRLLVFVPLLAFVYMFILPTIVRLWLGAPRAPMQTHFMTDDFWSRFPEWPVALLTFAVCGFLIVYLLGNKGFCTYGCPYGGIFGVADQVTPGRILVTDACEGCGHCTATCTSNVRVHEEVRTWGMVVDPGCMKCMDCVSVCPKDALHFGFGRPAVAKGRPRHPRTPRRSDFTWPEEIALAVIFLASVVVLRGLYDQVPFLLALGASAISAAALLAAGRMVYVDNLRFARVQLRRGGRLTRGGLLFALAAVLWTGFLVHSAAVKGFAFRGNRMLAAADASETDVRRALELLDRGQRWGLVPIGRLEAAMAGGRERLGELDAAETHYRRAVELSPRFAYGYMRLAALLTARGEQATAADLLHEALRHQPDMRDAAVTLTELLVTLERNDEAATVAYAILMRRPDDVDLRLRYGVTLAHAGDLDGSERELRRVIERRPDHVQAHLTLGQLLANQRRYDETLVLCERAAVLDPSLPTAPFMAGQAARQLGQRDVAMRHFEAARRLAPLNADIVAAWAGSVRDNGILDAAIVDAEKSDPADRATRFALVHLYQVSGRVDDAARVARELVGDRPPGDGP